MRAYFRLLAKGLSACRQNGRHKKTSTTAKEGAMFLTWLFFETKVGELLLVYLEKKVGLAVVDADWLTVQRCGLPKDLSKAE